jgi:hypothetical protein
MRLHSQACHAKGDILRQQRVCFSHVPIFLPMTAAAIKVILTKRWLDVVLSTNGEVKHKVHGDIDVGERIVGGGEDLPSTPQTRPSGSNRAERSDQHTYTATPRLDSHVEALS